MRGFVYILSNPFMPDVVKIGKTTRSVEQRANELFQTGLPAPFKVEAEFATPDCNALEQIAHDHLAPFRVTMAREFFALSARDSEQAIFGLHHDQISEWLSEFLPCHTLVEETYFIDPSTLDISAEKCGLSHYDMDQVFCHLTAEDLAPAAQRHLAACERRGQRIAAGLPAWPSSDDKNGEAVH